jgi:3-dehydroquinate dehydratase II
MPRILVLQGANMNALGERDTHIYGTTTAAELDAMIRAHAVARGAEVAIRYTNAEGQFIDWVYGAASEGLEAIVANPGRRTTRSGTRSTPSASSSMCRCRGRSASL